MKYTDYKKVFELAENIVVDVGAIDELCEELKGKLHELEGSFFDDGIESVKTYVGSIQKTLANSKESLDVIADQLCEYGEILARGK